MYEKVFGLQEEIFKVLANQKRLEIIHLLSNGELCVSEMIDMLGLAQANLSQHLSLMRRASLLKVSKRGTKVYYQLSDPAIAEAVFAVRGFLVGTNQFDDNDQQYFNQSIDLYPLVKDVVCGMRLSANTSNYNLEHNNEKYFFCASGCKQKFIDKPKEYQLTLDNKKQEKANV